MSIGLTNKKVAEYSTLPFAFLGARLISWMIELCESLGSNSPKTRPASVSYCPAEPNVAPAKAGDVLVSITMRVTLACVDEPQASNATLSATPNTVDLC